MENNPYFKERQRFRRFWFWLPVGLIDALVALGCVMQLGFGKRFGNHPATNPELIVIACLMFFFSIALSSIVLETEIGADGISVRLLPIIWRSKVYSWDRVAEAYLREYRAIRDFGGWGIKWGKGGTAYSIGGKFGIQLVFRDGSKLLIGTSKPREAEAVLQRLGRLKP